MKNKKVLCIIAVIIVAVIGIIAYHNLQGKYDGETDIRVVSPRNPNFSGAFEYNGELYFSNKKELMKYNEDCGSSSVVTFDSVDSDFTIYNGKIYLVSNKNEKCNLAIYDMNGTQISEKQELPINNLHSIGVSGNLLIGYTKQSEDEKIYKTFDMSNDFKEIDIPFTKFNEREISYCGYSTDYIHAGYYKYDFMVRNGEYTNYLSDCCIAANDKYFVYDKNIMPATVNYVDLSAQSFNSLSINNMLNENSMLTLSELNENIFIGAFRVTKDAPIGLNELINSDILRDHRYDMYAVIDLNSRKVLEKHKFHKYERIIFINGEKIVTYKNGKCITYSADDSSKLSEQDIDFIAEDKTYYFFSGTDNIYILDGKRENLIGRIPVN